MKSSAFKYAILTISFITALLWSLPAWTYSSEPVGYGGLKWGSPVPKDMKFLKEDPDVMDYIYTRPSDNSSLGKGGVESVHYAFNFMNEFYQVTIRGKDWSYYEKLLDHLEKTHGPADASDAGMKSSSFVWRGQTTVIAHHFDGTSKPGTFTLTYTGVKVVDSFVNTLKGMKDAIGGTRDGGKKEDPYKGLFD